MAQEIPVLRASRASAIAFAFSVLTHLARHPSTGEGFCIKFCPSDSQAIECTAALSRVEKNQLHERHDFHGRDSDLSRIQVKATGTNSKKSCAARAVCHDRVPRSFSRTYASNQSCRLEFRPPIGRVTAGQVELG